MRLRQECIGSICTGKASNGCTVTTTIKDDRRMFKLYRDLKLDVFEAKKKKNESTEGPSK